MRSIISLVIISLLVLLSPFSSVHAVTKASQTSVVDLSVQLTELQRGLDTLKQALAQLKSRLSAMDQKPVAQKPVVIKSITTPGPAKTTSQTALNSTATGGGETMIGCDLAEKFRCVSYCSTRGGYKGCVKNDITVAVLCVCNGVSAPTPPAPTSITESTWSTPTAKPVTVVSPTK